MGFRDQDAGTQGRRHRGILSYLLRDAKAATMPMMAIAIIPLAGFVGGAVDMSRLYITKTRLQQACDAGALAGRKVMGGGLWTANGNAANAAALQFFDTNFADGAYGTTGRTRSFSESAGRVVGTATATVPMTITRIFNQTATTLTVNCVAEMRLPNTDIMFVLDTTGSMDQTIPGDSSKKITTLKFAVKCFFETVARLATNANCGPDPSGGIGNQTQVRFGFVPYSTNVNVGKLLPTSYIADRWFYQTRVPQLTTVTETQWTDGQPSVVRVEYLNYDDKNNTSWSLVETVSATGKANCEGRAVPDPDVGSAVDNLTGPHGLQESISGNTRTYTAYTEQRFEGVRYRYNWNSNNGVCRKQKRPAEFDVRTYYSRTDTGQQVTRQEFANWRYARHEWDVSGLKNGSSWNDSVTLPIGNNGSGRTVDWDGCIEERATSASTTSYSPIPAGAHDLNIDMLPSSGVTGSYWGPALPEAVFLRGAEGYWETDEYVYTPFSSDSNYANPSYFCPTASKKLQVWSTASDYEDYVDSLNPTGNTYHDIGMVWGARLMSPTGIFADENDYTPQGGEIERHMIFMTDGETATQTYDYAAYGLPWFDRRQQTDQSSAPGSSYLNNQVNLRFSALCTEVKNKNITLWVVYFGSTDTATVNRMTACASPGRFFYANNSAQLLTAFGAIAAQISQLRLTE